MNKVCFVINYCIFYLLKIKNSIGDVMHSIDLSKYNIRTDLAVDIMKNYKFKQSNLNNIKVSNIFINKTMAKKILKKSGNYITIEFDDVTDFENNKKLEKVFINQLKKIYKKNNIKDSDTCLIVGLGNSKSTPDSLGPMVVSKILVTKHLFMISQINGFRCVSAISPGVLGQTGLETGLVIEALVKKFSPSFLLVIDSLVSSIERVNKTIQITDTGIHPGSGIMTGRKEISKDTLGIPCIAIGVPTVCEVVTIISDTIDDMTNNLLKEDILKKKSNFLESLSSSYNLMVTPKEIDFLIEKLSTLIANGINKSLHKNI